MRFKLVCCTSVSAISLLAGAAHAQTRPIEPAVDATASQKAEAGEAAAQDQAASPESDIVVTGFRAALHSAQELKRTSASIVDAVVSEDIGKLPDNNAAEALARIPGVQVVRSNDEAGQVLIRGLPNVTTTYNDREIFSTDDRQLHFQDFPTAVAAGIEVYKSGTADLIEPGLGGLINLRSRRPFDMKDVTIAGEVKGAYNDQSQTIEPAGHLILTKTWDTSIGEIGALLGGSYIRTKYRTAVRYNGASVITPTEGGSTVTTPGLGEFRYPDYIGNFYATGERERPSVNGMLQWRPSPDLEIYAEGLWSGYRGKVINDSFGMSLRGGTLSNVVLADGEEAKAASLTHSGGGSPSIERQGMKDRTDLYQGAVGFKWTTGRATLSGDFAYTKSRYSWDRTHVGAELTSTPNINAEFEVGGSGVFDLDGYDITNPGNYFWNGLWQSALVAQGDGYQGRLDLDLETDSSWLPKLQFGFRATTRTSEVQYGDRYAWTNPARIPLADLPTGELEVVKDGFRNDPQGLQNWLAPNGGAIIANSEALRALAQATLQQLGDTEGAARYSTEDVQYNPNSDFLGKERTYTAYAQGKYEFNIGSVQVDGTAGVRLAHTEGTSSGISRVDTNGTINFVPRTERQSWVDILPSFQSRIRFTPELQLRLAYTHTRSRPTYGQLNPALNVTLVPSNVNDPGAIQGFASSGNPNLQPLTSKNYDASLEYYFSKNGSATVAVFSRDLWGFINNYSREVIDPVYGKIQVNRPENAGKGSIKGVEASFQTFLDFLPGWLSGFGVQGNLTYLDAKNALPDDFEGASGMVPIVDVSKWTYNISAFYERGPISARLSYNRRSPYVKSYSRNANEEKYAGEITRAVSRLDASISYQISEEASIVATANNLLAKPWNNYRYYNEDQYFSRDLTAEGRYYSLAVRFKM